MSRLGRVLGMLSKAPPEFRSTYSQNGPMQLTVLTELYSQINSSMISSCKQRWDSESLYCGRRRISVCVPLNMGRRACKIADRKGAQNLKKSKRYGKISKEVISANDLIMKGAGTKLHSNYSVKRGGANPTSNSLLAAVIQKAKELDVPKDIVERNIKKALDKGQEAFIEKFYEVHGFGGVGMIAEVLTDNLNRSSAFVKDIVKKNGGKMADPGSVLFKFRRARVINVKVDQVDKDKLLGVALDAGADDIIEPPVYEDDTENEQSARYFKVITTTENYNETMSKFREEGIPFEPDNGFELLPLSTIEPDDEAMELNRDLIEKLLELDDVDAVYTDQK
ncbi:probable transcriptional regulatory protein At2g25830 isoform X1 [Cryptomeria japonica]|uniref:probable transcriptional regulatory protein At2g25830 isoform X1 n=1 Tax=Cryptomeria japonica TaxID=3369 RepID=UPI0027DA5315|nr:probable transcriptional regulatory protein At2g25830 isoform X1 [Cryptomeria japonica]